MNALEEKTARSSETAQRFARCIDSAQQYVRDAADSWARGDAEEPSTLEVLLNVLNVFANEKFLLFPSGA